MKKLTFTTAIALALATAAYAQGQHGGMESAGSGPGFSAQRSNMGGGSGGPSNGVIY